MTKKIFLLLFFFVCSLHYLSAQILTSGGGPSAFTIVNYPGNFVSYYDGFSVVFRSAQVCNASPTMDIASKGPKTIVNLTGGALIAGDIQVNQVVTLVFDAANNNFRMISPSGNAGGGTGWSITGNSGTIDGTNFIGTTDDKPFNIRVFNQKAGRIETNTQNANTSFGYQAGNANTSGNYNTSFGYGTLYTNSTGIFNAANGANAMYFTTTGGQNTASGYSALYLNTTGSQNTAIGYQSLYDNTTGNYNTASGMYALKSNVAGSNATAIGYNAMYNANNQMGAFTNYNVAVGYEALRGSPAPASNTGNENTAVGYQSMTSNTSGSGNVTLGKEAMWNNSTGNWNTAIGAYALRSNNNNYNLAIGYGAMYNNNGGTKNQGIGANALFSNNSGSFNIGIGEAALYGNTNGNNNIGIGQDALRQNSTGSGNVAIGYNAGYNETGSNKLYIDNSSTATPLIGGDFAADRVDINGQVKITGGGPANGAVLTSDGAGLATWQMPGGGVSGSGTLNYVPKFTPDGTTLGNSRIYDNGTNVGIGWAPAWAPLHVAAGGPTNDVSYNLLLHNYPGPAAANNIGVGIEMATKDGNGGTGDVAYINAYATDVNVPSFTSALTFWTRNGGASLTEKVRIDGLGNMGIGTTTPASLLSVGAGVSSPFQVNSSGDIVKLNNVTTTFPAANAAGVLTNNGSGTLTWAAPAAGISGSGTLNFIPKFTPNGTTLGNSGIFEDATGKVGIGTSTPSYPLQIEGNITDDLIRIQNKNNVSGSSIQYINDAGVFKGAIGYANSGIAPPYGSKLFISSGSGVPVAFFTDDAGSGGTQRMTIENGTGNVGIGTASPNASSLLDISSTSKGILVPRVTAAQLAAMNPLPVAAQGLLVYQTDGSQGFYYNTSLTTVPTWIQVGTAGATGWSVTGNSGLTDNVNNYLGTINNVAINFRVNNAPAGRLADNTFLGLLAGNTISLGNSGSLNVAVGRYSLQSTTIGWSNVAVGTAAMSNNLTGQQNVAIGSDALNNNRAGSNAVAIGNSAMFYANDQGGGFVNYNAALGFEALRGSATPSSNTGNNNTALGYQTLLNNTKASDNVAVGKNALQANTNSGQNVAVGNEALTAQSYSNTGAAWATDNVAVGYRAMFVNNPTSNTNSGSQNTALGSYALTANTTGYLNTSIGYQSMYQNTTGNNNSAFGTWALYTNQTGTKNTATGISALGSNNNGSFNTASGFSALYSNVGGNDNSAFGYNALSSSTGSNNAALGKSALQNNGNSNSNTAIGTNTLFSNTLGTGNTALGYQAGYTGAPANANTTGNYNVFIGYNSGPGSATQRSNAIAIGKNALVDADNAMVLGGSGADAVNVGIGTATPGTRLEINNGAVAGAIKIVDGTQLANRVLTSDAAGVGTWQAAPSVVAGSGNQTLRHNGATWVATSFLYNTGTQIGIGTTNPQNMVDLAGNMAIGATFSGLNGAPANGLIVEGNAGFATALPLVKLDARATSAKGATAFENVFQVASSDAATPLALRFGVQTHLTPGSRYGSIEVDDAGTKRNLELQPNGGNVGIGSMVPAGSMLGVNGPSASFFNNNGAGYSMTLGGSLVDASTLVVDGSIGANATPAANVMLALKDGHIQTQQTVTFVSGTFGAPGPDLTFSGNSGSGNASVTFTAGMGSTDVAGQFAYVPCTAGCGAFAAGAQVTITFKKPYVKPPIVVLTPVNGNGNFFSKQVYVISTVNNFTLNYTVAPAAGQSVTVNYVVMEGN